MSSNWLIGVLAFGVCVSTMPFLRRLAAHWHLYDYPGALKIHRSPIPRLGGVAMMLAVCACLLSVGARFVHEYSLCILAFCGVWAISFADDLRSLPPLLRLAVHLVAGALLWTAGWRLHWFSSAGVDLVATTVFVAFVINAMNLFDGLDGLAAGTSAIAAVGFLWLLTDSGDPLGKIVAWTLAGVCFGMLVYNRPPATIFMGDSGSTLIGMLLAFLALDWIRIEPETHGVASPLLLISLPVGDAVVVILRRIRAGQSPFGGDRLHLYDLLSQHGWSAQAISITSMSITAALILVAGLAQRQGRAAQFVVFILFICLWRTSHLLSPVRRDLHTFQSSADGYQASKSIAE
jgi:UDP-GlcNAc:undecaprenyl-phosphate GlcNAc-1-phosphate transferase